MIRNIGEEMVEMKKYIVTMILCMGICILTSCGKIIEDNNNTIQKPQEKQETEYTNRLAEIDTMKTDTEENDIEENDIKEMHIEELEIKKESYIIPSGKTLETRIKTPEGYERIVYEPESLGDFLQNYPVKADGAPVLLYDGREKNNQSAHAAVFVLPIEEEDLQQCADSIMRMYAEYFYATKQYERILFHFVNGFAAEYTKWRDGYRISVDGNQVSWVKLAEYDDSYECFVRYLRMVFAYAGTLSMESEIEEISLEQAQSGDIFLRGGSPGHVVMIVDVCENKNGKKAFLLAQGYMPAQEFHVLKNPIHEENPWYYEEEMTYPLYTPEYTFSEGSLQRLQY